MKLKLDKYLLLFLLLATSCSDAKFPSLEEIEANEEYRLKMDYQKKTCLFVDENTDDATKNYCFHILNRLYELTEDKGYLYPTFLDLDN